MAVIKSKLNSDSELFTTHVKHHRALTEDLRRQVARIMDGGDERSRQRHISRGKLLPRDRINRLLDPGSPFLELGQLAGYELYADVIPAGGIIAGVGQISGQPCMVLANDATVKGGTYYPITVKKHLRAQEIAQENHLPCVYLVDSGGAFFTDASRRFPGQKPFRAHLLQSGEYVCSGYPPDCCGNGGHARPVAPTCQRCATRQSSLKIKGQFF